MNNLREVKDDLLREWITYKEEIILAISTDEDNRHVFIKWICNKFNFGESKELIRDFERETNTYIDPVKQIAKEEKAKEWDREL